MRVFQLQRSSRLARQRNGLPRPYDVIAGPQPLPEPADQRQVLWRGLFPDEVVTGRRCRPLSLAFPPFSAAVVCAGRFSASGPAVLRDHQHRCRRSRDALLWRPAVLTRWRQRWRHVRRKWDGCGGGRLSGLELSDWLYVCMTTDRAPSRHHFTSDWLTTE